MTDTALLAPQKPLTSSGRHRAERRTDRLFSWMLMGSGIAIILILVAIGTFLVAQSLPAIFAQDDLPNGATSFWAYVWPLAFGTVWSAVLALVIATPLALSVALFISHYAPRRLASVAGGAVDLLAAVPSVVFGLWGILVLAPAVAPIYGWLVEYLGWIPLFAGPASATGRTILTAAMVLAIMVLPIMTAMSGPRGPDCNLRNHGGQGVYQGRGPGLRPPLWPGGLHCQAGPRRAGHDHRKGPGHIQVPKEGV